MKHLIWTLILQASLFAQTYTTLYTFNTSDAGQSPTGGLVFDSNGNLYGTTRYGGDGGDGTVFELTPGGTETVLYNFQGWGAGDGSEPNGDLVIDATGNLYGTTIFGGAKNDGTVFELSLGQGGWTETILHSFQGSDGDNPEAGLALDSLENLYGSTIKGGASTNCGTNGCGTIFKLTAGTWAFHTLLNLGAMKTGGIMDPLIIDPKGNLYGSTNIVFKLSLVNGKWVHGLLYAFKRPIVGGLALDSSGNLYAIGEQEGNVYELTPASPRWKCQILNRLGFFPSSKALLSVPAIYGASNSGGMLGYGSVYELSGATWTYSDLFDFNSKTGIPEGNLTMDAQGNLYGVTEGDNTTSYGSVYEITP